MPGDLGSVPERHAGITLSRRRPIVVATTLVLVVALVGLATMEAGWWTESSASGSGTFRATGRPSTDRRRRRRSSIDRPG